MTTTTPTFVTQSALRRRLGITNRTFRKRIAIAGLSADGVLLEKSKQGHSQALFSVSKLPELRRALLVKKPVQTIA